MKNIVYLFIRNISINIYFKKYFFTFKRYWLHSTHFPFYIISLDETSPCFVTKVAAANGGVFSGDFAFPLCGCKSICPVLKTTVGMRQGKTPIRVGYVQNPPAETESEASSGTWFNYFT